MAEKRAVHSHSDFHALLNDLGEHLAASVPDGYHFTLIVFQYGEDADIGSLTSADHEGTAAAMRHTLKSIEEPDA